jgi:hypothetical protein
MVPQVDEQLRVPPLVGGSARGERHAGGGQHRHHGLTVGVSRPRWRHLGYRLGVFLPNRSRPRGLWRQWWRRGRLRGLWREWCEWSGRRVLWERARDTRQLAHGQRRRGVQVLMQLLYAAPSHSLCVNSCYRQSASSWACVSSCQSPDATDHDKDPCPTQIIFRLLEGSAAVVRAEVASVCRVGPSGWPGWCRRMGRRGARRRGAEDRGEVSSSTRRAALGVSGSSD